MEVLELRLLQQVIADGLAASATVSPFTIVSSVTCPVSLSPICTVFVSPNRRKSAGSPC